MNIRLLGLCAIIGAPFLLITYLTFGDALAQQKTSLDGLYSLLYISGWMCSIIGLWQAGATGTTRWGRLVLLIQALFLFLANISNIMLLLQIGLSSKLYFILDLFWPVSNIWMLATGITVVTAKRLKSWMRYIPLAVGLWIPVTLLLMLGSSKIPSMMLSGLYSAIAWMLLGLVVYQLESRQTFLKPHIA